MDSSIKQQLKQLCIDWLASEQSRTQMSLSRKTGVDKAYISRIVSGKWTDQIPALKQWNKLAQFFKVDSHIDSHNYLEIVGACRIAQSENRTIAIDGFTGSGKSYALKRYMKSNEHVYLVISDPTMTRKAFVLHLARLVGVRKLSNSVFVLLQDVIERVKNIDTATLIIFDEIEYLPHSAYHIIKTLMDNLEGHAGFVVCGIFRDMLEKMAQRGKTGMPQFLRRIGHSWIKMGPVEKRDVVSICKDKGILNDGVIAWLARECDNYHILVRYVMDLITISEANSIQMDVDLCIRLFKQ